MVNYTFPFSDAEMVNCYYLFCDDEMMNSFFDGKMMISFFDGEMGKVGRVTVIFFLLKKNYSFKLIFKI